ncbi:MAG: hypothetical protein AAGF12_17870 [Myxococcota bacterium]
MTARAPALLLFVSALLGAGCGDETSGTPGVNPTEGTDPVFEEGIPTPPVAPGDHIGQQMSLRAGQFAEGMEPATPLFRGTLETGDNQDYQAVLQAGRCFKVVGVGGPSVSDLDLFLFDPNGVQVQQDTATDAYPVLGLTHQICPTAPGAYRVQVRMYAGEGEFGVQVFQTRR